LAKKHEQLAIFDLKNQKVIETGIKRKIAASEDKMVRVDFDREATPEEIADLLNKLGNE